MSITRTVHLTFAVGLILASATCIDSSSGEANVDGLTAVVGARIWDGTGADVIPDGILLIRDGRIIGVAAAGELDVPSGANVVNVQGGTIIPGLINTHGHVGGILGLEGGHYDRENLIRQLRLYAEYGVTSVNSLGGDGPVGITLRDEQTASGLNRARIYVAGLVVTGATEGEALSMVQENADMGVDWMKIRVDDNLGTTRKMSPEVFSAVIERSHDLGIRLASHLFYHDDAKALLRAGTDFIAHSVRDEDVDEEFLGLLREKGVCYSPTLTREVSTFVYEDRPDFFDDPFFLAHADPAVLDVLQEPDRQAEVRASTSAQLYKEALRVAMRNVKRVADAGLPVAFGTDTGPAGRFQGYFEHMEMALMADAGLVPEQILRSATGDAANCLGLEDEIGTLLPGRWADFLVLRDDPLTDIDHLRSMESVWIAGEPLR
mgnify:CR=1 FL=1